MLKIYQYIWISGNTICKQRRCQMISDWFFDMSNWPSGRFVWFPQPSLQSMLNMRRSLATIFGNFLYLLKILATISSWFYAYWRSWRPILKDFMPTEDLGDPFLPILCLLKILASQWRPILAVFVLVSFQFKKNIVLVTF